MVLQNWHAVCTRISVGGSPDKEHSMSFKNIAAAMLLAALSLGALAHPAKAAPIYDNGPPGLFGGVCLFEITTVCAGPVDDFSIAGGGSIGSVGYYAFDSSITPSTLT